jgi:hypothetical protein
MSVLKVKFLTQIPLILRAAQQIQSRYWASATSGMEERFLSDSKMLKATS